MKVQVINTEKEQDKQELHENIPLFGTKEFNDMCFRFLGGGDIKEQ